jgi:hypothetical protein
MEVMIEAFSTTWVHFPIQLQYPTNIRRIGIDVRLENTASFIHQIHVWAGAGKKHEFTSLGWQGGTGGTNYYRILDMGKVITPTALGISVEIKAGDGEGHFEFKMVGASN